MKKKQLGFITVLLVFLIVLLTTLSSHNKTDNKKSIFGYQFFVVVSGSMEPEIKNGSIIAVRPTKNNDYAVDQIITYRKPNHDPETLITHRVVEKIVEGSTTLYVTKGDRNNNVDIERIPTENVIGLYQNVMIPFAGYFVQFANEKVGKIFFIILPSLIIVLFLIAYLYEEIQSLLQKKKLNSKG